MSSNSFHHPDWSLPVVRRRSQEKWMDFVEDLGDILISGGRCAFWKHTYPNQRAYNNAMSRLRKSGLVVKHHDDGKLPELKLTGLGRKTLPDYHFPEKFWNTKWNGYWYLLIFDVPESQRSYRDTLRGFLKRLRMGCLQKSVWITPYDIRPDYDDLQQAANIHAVSYLLETQTVLHQETAEIIENSWNFEKLAEAHRHYLAAYSKNLELLAASNYDSALLLRLLDREADAYVQCMRPDPLLPGKLLPAGYQGKKVYALHKQLRQAVRKQLMADII